MKQDNNKLVWIACFMTVIGALFWSAMFVIQQPRPLFIAFLIINIVVLMIDVACLIVDIRK